MIRSARPYSPAFLLHESYGFPVDLTEIMADEIGMKIDGPGFEAGAYTRSHFSST